jgi:hypothetical protein
VQLRDPYLPAVFAPERILPLLEWSNPFDDDCLIAALDETKIWHRF